MREIGFVTFGIGKPLDKFVTVRVNCFRMCLSNRHRVDFVKCVTCLIC